MSSIKILLVDDEEVSRAAVAKFLRRLGHEICECGDAEQALEEFFRGDYPLVLTDLKMPGLSGIELIQKITSSPSGWKTDCVIFTGYGDMTTAIAALRAKAYDYLLKPVEADELVYLIKRTEEHQALRRENKQLTENFRDEVKAATQETRNELSKLQKVVYQSSIGGDIVAESEKMKQVIEFALKYHEDRSMPVLIEGETGTGKEMIAKLIHYGKSAAKYSTPFIDLNCATFSPSLFESELFGYEAGSFTGGLAKGKKGKLDAASGGTLFLDELAEMPLEYQGKFLRVLQEKEYYRVGGLKKYTTNIRMICATNAVLEEEVRQKRFRQDLFFRLKVGYIQIPPLRERKEDILPLATMFLQRFSKEKKKKFERINKQASDFLENYHWPGNVRELSNVIEWIIFMHDGPEVTLSHLPTFNENRKNHFKEENTEKNILQLHLPQKGRSLKEIKEDVINQVLTLHDGNKSATARYLGISRKMMNQYGHPLENGDK